MRWQPLLARFVWGTFCLIGLLTTLWAGGSYYYIKSMLISMALQDPYVGQFQYSQLTLGPIAIPGEYLEIAFGGIGALGLVVMGFSVYQFRHCVREEGQ